MTPADMTGERYGRLVVLRRVESNEQGKARWLCLCDCGQEQVYARAVLIRGHAQSCGCLRRESCRLAAALGRASQSVNGRAYYPKPREYHGARDLAKAFGYLADMAA